MSKDRDDTFELPSIMGSQPIAAALPDAPGFPGELISFSIIHGWTAYSGVYEVMTFEPSERTVLARRYCVRDKNSYDYPLSWCFAGQKEDLGDHVTHTFIGLSSGNISPAPE